MNKMDWIMLCVFVVGVIFMIIGISGCTDILEPKYKCVDGIVYIRSDGAWIQALYYNDNKCLSLDTREVDGK